MNFFDFFPDLVKEIGLYNALFVVLFIAMWLSYIKSYNKNMIDKQNQIDRLAKENKEYREKFIKIVDQKLFKEEKK